MSAPASAQLRWDRQALDPELGAGLPGLQRKLASLIALGQVLVEFPAGEGDRRVLEFALLGG